MGVTNKNSSSGTPARGLQLVSRVSFLSAVSLICVIFCGCGGSSTLPDATGVKPNVLRLRITEISQVANKSLHVGEFDRDIEILTGTKAKVELGAVAFFGSTESERVILVDIKNVGDFTAEIIGYEAGCGCTKIQYDSDGILPGQQTQVALNVRLNPVTSASEQKVTVALNFRGGYATQIEIPLIAVPSIRVVGFPGNGRTALDAGIIEAQECSVRKELVASIELDACTEIETLGEGSIPYSSSFQVVSVIPEQIQFECENAGNSFHERLGNWGTHWTRFRVELRSAPALHLPRHVRIELVNVDGSRMFVDATLQHSKVCELSQSSFVFKEGHMNGEVVLNRSDGITLKISRMEFDPQFLDVVLQEIDNSSAKIALLVKQWPSERVSREFLKLTTDDGLESVVRVIMISPPNVQKRTEL